MIENMISSSSSRRFNSFFFNSYVAGKLPTYPFPRPTLTFTSGKMQYSQEHLKTMVYAKFGGQTESIMGDSKIENRLKLRANGRNNSQHCWPNRVGSYCVRLNVAKRLTRFKLCATTLNNDPNNFQVFSNLSLLLRELSGSKLKRLQIKKEMKRPRSALTVNERK